MKVNALRLCTLPAVLALAPTGCGDDGSPPASGSSTSTTSGTSTTGPDETSTGPASSTGMADDTSTGGSTTGDTDDDTGTTGPGIVDMGCPECLVLADGLVGGRGLNLHGDYVYFTDQDAGTVNRVHRDGGEVELLHEFQAEPYDVVANDEHVFWTSYVAGGSVWRANLPSGPPIPLSADDFPRMLQLQGDYVYWCAFNDMEGRVRRVPTTGIGMPPQTLATAGRGVADLVVDGPMLYFSAHDPPEMPGLAPPGAIYAASSEVPTDPMDLLSIAPDQAEPWGIDIVGDTVFWVNGTGNPPDLPQRVLSVPAIGGENPDILVSYQTAPWGLTVDADWIYYTDYTEVKALPHLGGEPTILADFQNIARSIVDDADSLYWITRDRVLRRPKPMR